MDFNTTIQLCDMNKHLRGPTSSVNIQIKTSYILGSHRFIHGRATWQQDATRASTVDYPVSHFYVSAQCACCKNTAAHRAQFCETDEIWLIYKPRLWIVNGMEELIKQVGWKRICRLSGMFRDSISFHRARKTKTCYVSIPRSGVGKTSFTVSTKVTSTTTIHDTSNTCHVLWRKSEMIFRQPLVAQLWLTNTSRSKAGCDKS